MQQFHLRLDNATAKALVVLAKKTERSKSAIIRHLVKREFASLTHHAAPALDATRGQIPTGMEKLNHEPEQLTAGRGGQVDGAENMGTALGV